MIKSRPCCWRFGKSSAKVAYQMNNVPEHFTFAPLCFDISKQIQFFNI